MATSKSLTVNGKRVTVKVDDPDMPLLYALRDNLALKGPRFGCGLAQCGACTVHIDGVAVRSCVTPVSRAAGKQVTTIEGLSPDNSHPLQRAWIEEDVPQCGYCQGGMIMSAAALLTNDAAPTDGAIDAALRGHICRC